MSEQIIEILCCAVSLALVAGMTFLFFIQITGGF